MRDVEDAKKARALELLEERISYRNIAEEVKGGKFTVQRWARPEVSQRGAMRNKGRVGTSSSFEYLPSYQLQATGDGPFSYPLH
jgi:hypothetical protein